MGTDTCIHVIIYYIYIYTYLDTYKSMHMHFYGVKSVFFLNNVLICFITAQYLGACLGRLGHLVAGFNVHR